jgi:hypothetical protein
MQWALGQITMITRAFQHGCGNNCIVCKQLLQQYYCSQYAATDKSMQCISPATQAVPLASSTTSVFLHHKSMHIQHNTCLTVLAQGMLHLDNGTNHITGLECHANLRIATGTVPDF